MGVPVKKIQVGDRVGAIASMSSELLRLFGYGTYEGDEIPGDDVIGPFGPVQIPNPKIKLDNGDVVWGCECWWAPEDQIKKRVEEFMAAGKEVKDITVAQYRNG